MLMTNKAVGFFQHLAINDPRSFEDLTIAEPKIKAHDLLVKVSGISVNPVDTFIRGGGRPSKLAHPKIIGWDAVGTVVKVGKDCTLFKLGDRVWYAGDFRRSGSNSRFQAVDERIVGRAPSNLSDDNAAAIPLVGLTAYESIFEKLEINWDISKNEGKKILIINGSGGVGSMAIQLAKLVGLTVVATASKSASVEWAKKLKADYIIDHHKDLVQQLHLKNIDYVDYVLNLNNLDDHWNEIAEIIRPDGRIAATTENHKLIDLQKLTKKRATFSWEWMFSKSYYHTDDMISQYRILNHIAELFESQKLKPIMTMTYLPINAENLKRAHKDVEAGRMVGKVTITGWEA
ncbi:zinc-binding alcohol dehydrogenase family protein [Dellaglioa sp. P0083]|uniref:zinc-binding alcohol dehydrogenase family protein n=1 Tax=Dellaglioa kimchii TaxID=3344667 RepID=UPI0038D4C28E